MWASEYWAREGTDVWTFNGDFEKPTFRASMLSQNPDYSRTRRICHSFLTDGVWNFLTDCTHDLAGQSVPMVPITEYDR